MEPPKHRKNFKPQRRSGIAHQNWNENKDCWFCGSTMVDGAFSFLAVSKEKIQGGREDEEVCEKQMRKK
ncbi:hypothetical protein TSUD_336110 [Trifolium subterraneum]|uniref:Uncharacterized protein n=1 Tax=Trifolium subterraneum TaxID=3900 RepID=A0A2Z6MT19_TRISU|nr:hypothetical protein TSUD_336110 [Trifolium subterraneum]